VERTLLSAAFDFDFDFEVDLEGARAVKRDRGRAALQRRVTAHKRNRASAPVDFRCKYFVDDVVSGSFSGFAA
jgi:hypothetical protein